MAGQLVGWHQVEKAFVDSATDSSSWAHALELVKARTQSFGVVLIPSTGGMLPHIPFTAGMERSSERYFREGWYLKDERNRGIALMKKRGVVDDLDLFGADEISRHPYYQEFLALDRLRWFAGVRIMCGEDLWCLSIQRTIEQGPFSMQEKNQFAQLSDRLSATAALARAFGASHANGALDAFEKSSTAVVLVNRHGLAFKANTAAEHLLNEPDVTIAKGRIISSDSSATKKLDQALHKLMWLQPEGGLTEPIRFSRRNKRPVVAFPMKLARSTANPLWDCQALVILIDLERQHRPQERALQAIFGVTAAEARLACRLAGGRSLESATEEIGISKETGRNQLKNVFFKVGVNRQSELLAVLSSILVQEQ